jgi:hypothetical protein
MPATVTSSLGMRGSSSCPIGPARSEDLARLEPAGVDEVRFSNQAAGDLDGEVRLLEELRAASAGG